MKIIIERSDLGIIQSVSVEALDAEGRKLLSQVLPVYAKQDVNIDKINDLVLREATKLLINSSETFSLIKVVKLIMLFTGWGIGQSRTWFELNFPDYSKEKLSTEDMEQI